MQGGVTVTVYTVTYENTADLLGMVDVSHSEYPEAASPDVALKYALTDVDENSDQW